LKCRTFLLLNCIMRSVLNHSLSHFYKLFPSLLFIISKSSDLNDSADTGGEELAQEIM
jgi:hypothetical protein